MKKAISSAETLRRSFVMLLLMFSFVAGIGSVHASSGGASVQALRVQVSKSQIREYPSVLAPVLATLAYGQAVDAFEAAKEGWIRVQVPGSSRLGYMLVSALTEKNMDLSGGGQAETGVSGTELVLAGKGFNESTEETYRQNSNLDYASVDAMEDFDYPQETLAGFMEGFSP